MIRGEVWLVTLPFASGREQTGQRPCIVIQDEVYGQDSPLVLVVPLSSQLAALRFPGTVQFEPSPENGLSLSSVALIFQTRACDRSRFVRRVGMITADELVTIFAELMKLTGRN